MQCNDNSDNIVYLNSAKRAANWIIDSINTEGAFAKYHYVENFSPSYYTRVCWPLLEVYDLTKDTNISTKVSNALEYIAKKQLKNSFNAFETHLNGASKSKWHQSRKEAFAFFTDNGLPKAKDEEYRYTHIGRAIEKSIDFSNFLLHFYTIFSPERKTSICCNMFSVLNLISMSEASAVGLFILLLACWLIKLLMLIPP